MGVRESRKRRTQGEKGGSEREGKDERRERKLGVRERGKGLTAISWGEESERLGHDGVVEGGGLAVFVDAQ